MKFMIVPARAGSKRIRNKNIRLLGGDPLVIWTLKVSVNCGLPTVFSTDSHKYIDIVHKYFGDDIEYELRPNEMALDNTRVVEEVARICQTREVKPEDTIGVMLPTSPFKTIKSLREAIAMNEQTGRGVFSASEYGFPVKFAFEKKFSDHTSPSWNPIFGSDSPMVSGNTRSQNQKTYYHPNGAIYVFNYKDFVVEKNFYMNADPLILSGRECLDIDNELDFSIAEAFISKKEI